ncbi:TrkH family potassium uptake protein [Herbivorax sp. ANBcel31]|uniref:TrkH family potassium uptake protein n=1 Tax=Herbivorax sp. ANBcel31 TaxID=3069754 RepID=UPI0027B71ECC|nr:TrkH family potassium uptake protein [Herbivorax sp. ANBcel31]MDQ2085712.1 TrkH family potassium uptake protein [Herbivorax sp. ANBcel31]
MIKFQFSVKNRKLFQLEPAKVIVLSFIIVILSGTLLLTLPIASNAHVEKADFLTALFTATSATCVTGLVVVDTGTQWSLFGQIVILTLIQIGALGFVTFATFFSVLLGRKVGLKTMILAQQSLSDFSFEGVVNLIKNVVLATFSIQLAGALILSTRFVPHFGLEGFYISIFHSISSFCNAGFDILGGYQSLTNYNDDPILLFITSTLIIFGGLGFVVWKNLWEYRKDKVLLLHTKVVLGLVFSLIAFGTIFFFFSEFNNPYTLGQLNLSEKMSAAFFQSVTTRTAGFNSIDTGSMQEISKAMSILLMFIGAAPGSTGGGVKITTFGVILVAVISQIRGSQHTIVFKRRVPYLTVTKALAIVSLSAIVIVTLTTILLAIEDLPFLDVFFESVSAFGTVGLSAIGTSTLSNISRIFLIITMFVGRIGPLSFAIALTMQNTRKKKQDVVYPEGKIIVG